MFSALVCALCLVLPAGAQDRVRVACVGNSVTYGYTLGDRERDCYPSQLQRMLGEGFEVGNFGHSGATLMRHGHRPYNTLEECAGALAFKGDIVVIHLGLNDTDPRNYTQRGEEFIPDYHALIDSLKSVNPTCKIYICLMTPIFEGHPRFLSGTRDWHAQIQDDIRRVALRDDVTLIDLYTPLHCFPNLFPDNLHPNAEGARILAQTVFDAITGHARVALSLGDVYQSSMVLQREAANTIKGRAPMGYEVTVALNGRKATAMVGEDGKWSATLPAMKAGGPYKMTVEGRLKDGVAHILETPVRQSVALDSVYIGEVWLCSGQSNMEWVNGNLPLELRPEICRTGRGDAADGRVHLYRMKGACGITTNGSWSDSLLAETNALRFIQKGRWQRASRETVNDFSAIGYRVARAIADSLGCHVGVISNAIGGSGIEAWIDRTTMEWEMPEVLLSGRPSKSDFLMDWVRKCIGQNTSGSKDALQRHPFDPCYLYESSIAPLEGLTLRGVMWYQGESNAHNIEMYERQWRALTRQWRRVFRSADGGNLPFYTMQLSAIGGRPSWGRFRDMQRRLAEEDARTYLVVTHDVGERGNVHPNRKDVQAARLAQTILKGEESPVVTGAEVKGGVVTLTFSEELVGDAGEFEVCGEDGVFHAAEAAVAGNMVTLRSERVALPERVRYAWGCFTRANLRGKGSGLVVSSVMLKVR